MKYLILVILFLSFLPNCFAEDTSYVFLIDENQNPVIGYKVIETPVDSVFMSSLEPLKKWISLVRSSIVLVKNGYLYPIIDSLILDRKKGIVLLIIDNSRKKPLYFIPEEFEIKRDTKVLVENRNIAIAKVKELFSQEIKVKREDPTATANQLMQTGQFLKALQIYEEILKEKPNDDKILEKIGILYYRIGDYQKAKEIFLKLPINEERLEKIVGILIITKDFSFAQRLIEKTSKINSVYIHYLKGVVYYLNGEKDNAYREVVSLFNKNQKLAQNLKDLLR